MGDEQDQSLKYLRLSSLSNCFYSQIQDEEYIWPFGLSHNLVRSSSSVNRIENEEILKLSEVSRVKKEESVNMRKRIAETDSRSNYLITYDVRTNRMQLHNPYLYILYVIGRHPNTPQFNLLPTPHETGIEFYDLDGNNHCLDLKNPLSPWCINQLPQLLMLIIRNIFPPKPGNEKKYYEKLGWIDVSKKLETVFPYPSFDQSEKADSLRYHWCQIALLHSNRFHSILFQFSLLIEMRAVHATGAPSLFHMLCPEADRRDSVMSCGCSVSCKVAS
ncbi:unnamed protein product [Albugo candida]|uniref:Uncharacterized protein n=1 Tax=Albugo candida TaxID=65357 RepID=A0A024GHE2_9STRA|nr:unnamed protein product [Albugo candida]|eukprot:CCI46313.1 unnamed protein product [Albugo candida]